MDIQTTKLKLLKTILENEDAEFLQRLANFVKSEKSDFWKELNPAQQEEIRRGIEELEEGKRVPSELVFKKIS